MSRRTELIRSVLRLSVAALASLVLSAGAAGADPDPMLDAYLARLRAAAQSGDPNAFADLTRLPFLYDGRRRDRPAFLRIVPRLFTPAVRKCMAKAGAVAEGADRVIYCKPYSFYLRRDGGGRYLLEEFAADGEDADG